MQRYPILIGISGKRVLDEDVTTDRALEQALAARFRAVFAALDADLPDTPKVVLTGAAFGADLIAAQAALQAGGNWAVAAILPFARALFAEDFDPALDKKRGEAWRDRYLEHAGKFDSVLGPAATPNARMLVRELPLLAAAGQGVAAAERLSRMAAQYDKAYRRNHYEQVGQYIAEISTIMIAVMGRDEQAEMSEANGGTARIVAYRRAGRPDAPGAAVARRSSVLRGEWPDVIPPPAQHVWLMDPHREDRTGRYPVKVLAPLADRSVDEAYGGHPGRDAVQEHEAYVGPLRKLTNAWRALAGGAASAERSARRAEARRLRASLPVARGINRYNSTSRRPAGTAATAVVADISAVASIPNALNQERVQISSLQRAVNEHAKRSFRRLAYLFVAAVFVYEIFAKFFHDSPIVLGIYLLVLAFIGRLALIERFKLSQAVAEDYRAVAEILRVQRAWCSAGLDARADREHLQGVDQDLAPIRDCAKTIIAWIILRHGWTSGASVRDWAQVRGTSPQARELRGVKKSPDDWIGSQLWYFIKNGEDREAWAARVDAVSWCLFVTSGVLGAVLWTWLLPGNARSFFAHLAHVPLPGWAPTIGFDASFLLWTALAALTIRFRGANHDFRQGLQAIVLTGALGALAAIWLALAFINAEPLIIDLIDRLARVLGLGGEAPDHYYTVINAVISALVVLYAIAGAKRYLMERLNIEAEALEYRDARARFELAERRLAPGSDPASGTPADEEAAQRLVHELGRLALAENEAWLKSRRERPLTPIVG
jgi:hypothetical protein